MGSELNAQTGGFTASRFLFETRGKTLAITAPDL
jgi:hypothetical protein